MKKNQVLNLDHPVVNYLLDSKTYGQFKQLKRLYIGSNTKIDPYVKAILDATPEELKEMKKIRAQLRREKRGKYAEAPKRLTKAQQAEQSAANAKEQKKIRRQLRNERKKAEALKAQKAEARRLRRQARAEKARKQVNATIKKAANKGKAA